MLQCPLYGLESFPELVHPAVVTPPLMSRVRFRRNTSGETTRTKRIGRNELDETNWRRRIGRNQTVERIGTKSAKRARIKQFPTKLIERGRSEFWTNRMGVQDNGLTTQEDVDCCAQIELDGMQSDQKMLLYKLAKLAVSLHSHAIATIVVGERFFVAAKRPKFGQSSLTCLLGNCALTAYIHIRLYRYV